MSRVRLARFLLVASSLTPLLILAALSVVEAGIEHSFRTRRDGVYLFSLRFLMAVLGLSMASPLMAILVARWSGLQTTRGTAMWIASYVGTMLFVFLVMELWTGD